MTGRRKEEESREEDRREQQFHFKGTQTSSLHTVEIRL